MTVLGIDASVQMSANRVLPGETSYIFVDTNNMADNSSCSLSVTGTTNFNTPIVTQGTADPSRFRVAVSTNHQIQSSGDIDVPMTIICGENVVEKVAKLNVLNLQSPPRIISLGGDVGTPNTRSFDFSIEENIEALILGESNDIMDDLDVELGFVGQSGDALVVPENNDSNNGDTGLNDNSQGDTRDSDASSQSLFDNPSALIIGFLAGGLMMAVVGPSLIGRKEEDDDL